MSLIQKICFSYLAIAFLLNFNVAMAQDSNKRERYKSESTTQKYDSKNREQRKNFDKNFGRYQTLSPSQKREKMDKWRDFKSNTTPEERDFIMKKMRKEKRRSNR